MAESSRQTDQNRRKNGHLYFAFEVWRFEEASVMTAGAQRSG